MFLDRLTDRGVLHGQPLVRPRRARRDRAHVEPRVAALLENGVAEPRQHIVLATQGRIATMLVSSKPFEAPTSRCLRTLRECTSTKSS